MPYYKFKAKDTNPKSNTYKQDIIGHVTARSEEHATLRLAKKNLMTRHLVEVDTTLTTIQRYNGITIDELIVFSRQVQTLLESGVDILNTLSSVIKVSKSPRLKHELRKLYDHVNIGNSLSSYFDGNRAFPESMQVLLMAGEKTGLLSEGFRMLGDHLEFQQGNVRKIREALNKPKQTAFMIIVIVTLMMIFVIPTLVHGLTGELPLPTRILISVSDIITNDWHFIVLVILNSYVFLRLIKSKGGDIWYDKNKHKIPIIGEIVQKHEMIQFTRSVAMLNNAGIPIIETFMISIESTGNLHYKQRVKIMCDSIEQGESIANSAVRADIFPLIVETMLSIGEKSGSISKIMENISTLYKREIDFELKMLNDRLQPFILLVCGGLVLLVALGVYLPILERLVSI